MKTLTIKQPWASLIIKGIKDVENRRWVIPGQLPAAVLIHAGKILDADALEYLRNGDNEDCRLAQEAIRNKVLPAYAYLPTSAILGYVTFKECVTNSDSPWAIPGENHWIIDEVYEFDKPIKPVSGKQGLFDTRGISMDKMPAGHFVKKR